MIEVCPIENDDPLIRGVARVGESTACWLGTWDKFPAAAWGIIPDSCLSDKAYLWSKCWPQTLKLFRRQFLLASRVVIAALQEEYPVLYGMTHRETSWLKHLGAEFGPVYEGWDTFILRKK